MTLPSHELHDAAPIFFTEFTGLSVHEALIVQKAIRARVNRLDAVIPKQKGAIVELKALDLQLSLYVVEEIRKGENSN